MNDPAGGMESWLSGARAGSLDDLGQVLNVCRPYLLGIAQRELDADLRAKGGASDLVQETFLDAQRLFLRFAGGSEAELLAWLRQLLLNNLADFTRRYRTAGKRNVGREVALTSDASAGSDAFAPVDSVTPSRMMRRNEQTAALDRALAQLPEEYRQVLTLRHQEDLPFEEVGRRLGRSENAARKLWARAVRQLQQAMGDMGNVSG